MRYEFWGGLYLDGLIHGGAYFRNFTVFMNDLVYVIKRSNLSTYPDDTQIFFADKGPVIVQETINSDLSYVDKWFLENGMKRNLSKYQDCGDGL